MKIDRITVFKKMTSSIIEAEVVDEIIILHLEDGKYHHMNSTALLLWKHLNEPISTASLAQKLANTFGYDANQYEADILQWLTDCLSKQLVELVLPKIPFSETDYISPLTNSFDILEVTGGSSAEFQTDNLETGS